MLGFYNYTVILTYAGMLAAFSGILAAVNGSPKTALVCLMSVSYTHLPLWYDITEWLGAAAVLFALGFAALGLCQLIRRRSLWKVDTRILLLGAFYMVVALSSFLSGNIVYRITCPRRHTYNIVIINVLLKHVIKNSG